MSSLYPPSLFLRRQESTRRAALKGAPVLETIAKILSESPPAPGAAFRNRPPMQEGCPLLADWGVGTEPEYSTTGVSQRAPYWGRFRGAAARTFGVFQTVPQSLILAYG